MLLAGCLGSIGTTSNGSDGSTDGDATGPPQCHGLLTADVPFRPPNETVPISNDTVQSTEPIRTILEDYRENGTRQRMGVDDARAKATSRALQQLDHDPETVHGPYVRFEDDTVAEVGLSANGSLCGGPL